MGTASVARLFVRCLESEGVDWVFGVPGEENLALLEALADSPIRFVTTRHEQGAAFMADVYGRLSGRAGVCLATLGPGATNLLTGVADANMDHAPVVAIAGQAATTRLHKESHQVLDLVRIFQPVTKYAARILAPEVVPEVLRKAFKLAQTHKPGACFVELPEDLAEAPVDAQVEARPLAPVQPTLPEPAAAQVEAAAELLSAARHPLVLAGNGVVRTGACQALAEFAGRLHVPVANTFMAKGAIPFKHPMALGSVGLQAQDYVNAGFDRADVILCVGYDLVEYHPHLWHPTADRTLIHVDVVPAEVDTHYEVSVGVVGDIRHSLARIAERARPRQEPVPRPLRQALITDMDRHKDDLSFPLRPQKIIWDLRTVLPLEDIVVCDVGAHKLWMARMFRCELPNTCLISNGFASMGIALPGAVAACLARPERRVVAVTGDGGFLMNVQELETAVRLGLRLVVLVWNDGGYGLIAWKQRRRYGREAFTRFGNPDLVGLAQSFGALGLRVRQAAELAPLLRRALEHPGVSVIDCPVDYGENQQLAARLGETVFQP